MRAAFARRWIATDPADARQRSITKSTSSTNRSPKTSRSPRNARSRCAPPAPPTTCSAAVERLESHQRAAARRHQARRELGDARPLCRQGRRPDRSAGELHGRRRLPVPPERARRGRARCATQHRRHRRWRCCCRRWSPGPWRGRIVGPVAVASSVAERIAAGKLDVAVPDGSADELGALLAAMGVMRDNIKAMMDREVEQRRSAQARLADALECSQEGVVVVDANDGIVLANAQAARFARRLRRHCSSPARRCRSCEPALQGTVDAGHVLMRRDGELQATERDLDGRRALAAHQPQPDPRRRLHRAVQRHQPLEGRRNGACAKPTCCSTPRWKTCRKACAFTMRRTGSRSSIGASWKSSGCRANGSGRA